jgi:hypothetical protein
MKGIAGEVKALMPVLLSAEDLGTARFAPATAPIHTKLKRLNGREYLIAVNAGNDAVAVTFDLRHKLPAQVPVMFEKTNAATEGETLAAGFKPLEVHVYDLGAVK